MSLDAENLVSTGFPPFLHDSTGFNSYRVYHLFTLLSRVVFNDFLSLNLHIFVTFNKYISLAQNMVNIAHFNQKLSAFKIKIIDNGFFW